MGDCTVKVTNMQIKSLSRRRFLAALSSAGTANLFGAGASLAGARSALVGRAGKAAMIDAAAVIAGFDAITRVADGTGIPLEPPKAAASADWRSGLGIDAFWTAKV